MGRLGVSLFLFLTGYLLLYKNIDKTINYKEFCKKKILPLLIKIEMWILIYNIFLSIFYHIPFHFDNLIMNMLFISNISLPHIWYLPMILGIYIFLPLVAIILKNIDFKFLNKFMSFMFIFVFIIPALQLTTKLDLSFSGGLYGFYVLTGYILGKGTLKNIKKIYLYIILILSIITSFYYQITLSYYDINSKIWYSHFSLFISALVIFELISRLNLHNLSNFTKLIEHISKISFNIYFIHIVIQYILVKYISFSTTPISTLLLMFLVLFFSIFIASILEYLKNIISKVRNKKLLKRKLILAFFFICKNSIYRHKTKLASKHLFKYVV